MSGILNRLNNSPFNSLSAKDKRHIWIILIILAAATAAGAMARHAGSQPTAQSALSECDTAMLGRLAALDSALRTQQQQPDTMSALDTYIMRRYDTIALFDFDPNTISEDGLQKLGLTAKQAATIAKYRAKGGKFRNPEDFMKMYGMRDMQYRILSPYIKIASAGPAAQEPAAEPGSGPAPQEHQAQQERERLFCFDPNSISEEDFMKLGFSSRQAQSFAAYRAKGKKFYVPADIADAYCVDSKAYARISPYIRINTDSLTRGGQIRDLNTIDLQGLMECGLSSDEASKILEFRNKAGFFYAPWQIGDIIGSKRGNKIKDKLYVCRSVERRIININSASQAEMSGNPYFSDLQAARIVELRGEMGSLQAKDLVEKGIFSEKEMKRVANYIGY